MKIFLVMEIDALDYSQKGEIVAIHKTKKNAAYTAKLMGSYSGTRYTFKVKRITVQK